MKPLVIDTNVLIDFCQKPLSFNHSALGTCGQMLIPSVVIGEFKAGILDTRRGAESQKRLLELLSYVEVNTAPVTDATAEMYAKVFKALKAQGRPIPQNDMWIAASALEHGADILTYDEHFRAVPMLTVIIPEHE